MWLRSDIDKQDFSCWEQCKRDREEEQANEHSYGAERPPPITVNPADTNFVEFCERTRLVLLADCEISALLVKLREGKLTLGNPTDGHWHPQKWLNAIFSNVQALGNGVTYMKSALEQPKAGEEREGIDGLGVADMLLHIGFIKPPVATHGAREPELEKPLIVCHRDITLSDGKCTRTSGGDGSRALAAATDVFDSSALSASLVFEAKVVKMGPFGIAIGLLPAFSAEEESRRAELEAEKHFAEWHAEPEPEPEPEPDPAALQRGPTTVDAAQEEPEPEPEPAPDVETGENLFNAPGGCFYGLRTGQRYPTKNRASGDDGDDWDGMESTEEGDTLEFRFDRQGTLTIAKNGVELGVIAEHLQGRFRLTVSLRSKDDCVLVTKKPDASYIPDRLYSIAKRVRSVPTLVGSDDKALARLQRFVDDSRELDRLKTQSSDRSIADKIWTKATTTSEEVTKSPKDLLTETTKELLTNLDKALGYSSDFNQAAMDLGYTSKSDRDNGDNAGTQRVSEVCEFLQVVRTMQRYIATVEGRGLKVGAVVRACPVKDKEVKSEEKQEESWQLERAEIIETLPDERVRLRWKGGLREEVVSKKKLGQPSVWEELMWSETLPDVGLFRHGVRDSDLQTVQACVEAVKKHIQDRGAPLWRRWVRGKPYCFSYEQLAKLNQGKVPDESSVVFPSKVPDGGHEEDQSSIDLYNFCTCLQRVGYTGTAKELEPLFKEIVEWEKQEKQRTQGDEEAGQVKVEQRERKLNGKGMTRRFLGEPKEWNKGEWEWRRAIDILRRSRDGVNYAVDDQLRWERNDSHRRRLWLIPRVLCSRTYEKVVALSCVVHICLAFFEAPALRTGLSTEEEAMERLDNLHPLQGLKGWAFFCVAIYWIDFLMMMYWHGSRHGCKKPLRGLKLFPRRSHKVGWGHAWSALDPSIPARQGAAEAREQHEKEWAERKLKLHLVAKMLILFAITVDYFLQFTSILHDCGWHLPFAQTLETGYSTAPHDLNGPESGPWNVYLLLPYTAVLRPCMLVLRSDSLRAGAADFVKTMQRSKDIFLMCMLVLIFFGAFSVALFASNHHQKPENTHLFEHVFRAFTTFFTYMTTAANWPDVVWAPVDCAEDDGVYESGGCARWTFHVFFMLGSIVVGFTSAAVLPRLLLLGYALTLLVVCRAR